MVELQFAKGVHIGVELTAPAAIGRDRFLALGELRMKLEHHHGNNTECAFLGWNGAWLHPDFVSWNLEEYLPGIRVPMLAIQGEHDEYGTAAQSEVIARQVGPDVEVMMLSDCGHSPHRDQEQIVLEAMTAFVRTVFDGV